MRTRVALFAASLTASAVLAIGMAMFGLGPTVRPAVTVAPVAATDVPAVPVTQVDTTYVVPPTPAADPTPSPIVIQRVVTTGGEHEDEHGDS